MLPTYMQDNAALVVSRTDAHPLIKHHALELILFGYTTIRGCFSPEYCHGVIQRFKQFERVNQTIFDENRASNGRLARVVNLHLGLKELIPLFSQNTVLLGVQDLLFGRPVSLYTSLFYEYGSEQPPHRDTPVFCTRPEYLYFGNTVYLEPADEGNGCLEVIEGGHTVGELDREALAKQRYGSLENVPALDNELWIEYQNRVVGRCDRLNLPRRRLLMNAGDAVIWHPQLPHGGSPIADPKRTRYSFVFHTAPEGVPVYHQDVFFRPNQPTPETPNWGYFRVNGRPVADHRNGISFGEPSHRSYTFDAFRI